MNKDEWSAFLLQRIQHHVHEYTDPASPNRGVKVDPIVALFGTGWPSGWNLNVSEAGVIFGVVHDTLLDTLEELGQLQSAQ